MSIKKMICIACVACLGYACIEAEKTTLSGLLPKNFRTEVKGQYTDLYVLRNANGMEACVTNYGARLVSLMAPDRHGKMEDVVCGFDSISDYLTFSQNFGSTVGRYIGRILQASFTLDSITYKLNSGNGKHISHGGNPGFANSMWTAEQPDGASVLLTLVSPDGDNGFPGTLTVRVLYRLTDDNALAISFEAETDKPTVLNLSNHSFFNISGDFYATVEDQLLYVDADAYTPYDDQKCVTGEILPVQGTPFDFTTPRFIGERINEDHAQLHVTKGYDHTLVLNHPGDISRVAVRLTDAKSGRIMEVYTTEPGVHVYTANGLRGKYSGKQGIRYDNRTAVCFETQHFADSPNKPQFPSTVLRPGEKFESRTVFQFGIEPDIAN